MKTLVVLAAGIGSRFGGIKQMQKVANNGWCLLDFAVYDAIKAGCQKVVFVVRQDIAEDFHQLVGKRWQNKIEVVYAMQTAPTPPRTKPYGTGHALLCCKNLVEDNFVVINADDYYGKQAFADMFHHLDKAKQGQYALATYRLGDTLSRNGNVTRGVCTVQHNKLVSIRETHNIAPNGQFADGKSTKTLPLDMPVSMNMWALTTNVFDILQKQFEQFLQNEQSLAQEEFYIPVAIGEALAKKQVTVKVYPTADKWLGITHRDDLANVAQTLQKYVDDGLYD